MVSAIYVAYYMQMTFENVKLLLHFFCVFFVFFLYAAITAGGHRSSYGGGNTEGSEPRSEGVRASTFGFGAQSLLSWVRASNKGSELQLLVFSAQSLLFWVRASTFSF